MITTCTKCGRAYEAGSEEQANEPARLCFSCRAAGQRGNWTDGECFYVDAVDGPRVALLVGPFRTLAEAESRVDEARRLAVDYDTKAHFYAFGCSKWAHGHREGKFNKELGL